MFQILSASFFNQCADTFTPDVSISPNSFCWSKGNPAFLISFSVSNLTIESLDTHFSLPAICCRKSKIAISLAGIEIPLLAK